MYVIREATREEVESLRAIANHQFRINIGSKLIPGDVLLKISKNTGRVRELLTRDGVKIAAVRASTFTLNLSLYAARILHESTKKLRAIIASDVANYVVNGTSVFSRHVLDVDPSLRAGDEVLVVDESDKLLCIGRLMLSPYEIMFFTRGVAIKLRECGVTQ